MAKNVLARDFTAEKAHQKWVADITDIATREGWLSLATVIDLCTRKVVGWSMSERIDSRLVVDVLEMAESRQLPVSSEHSDAGVIAHSDRGVQYASEHDQRTLTTHGLQCRMSRRGDCWDNTPAESFFATLKKELVHHEVYETRTEARASLFESIEACQTICPTLNPAHANLGQVHTLGRSWQLSTLPNRPLHCRATPTDFVPFLANADGPNTITPSPTRHFRAVAVDKANLPRLQHRLDSTDKAVLLDKDAAHDWQKKITALQLIKRFQFR